LLASLPGDRERGRNQTPFHLFPRRPALIQITRLPEEVKRFLLPLKPLFSYRHFLVFCWLIVAQLICFEKAPFKAVGRYTPKHIAWWHLRRLVACSRWPWEEVLEWLVSQCLSAFPPPGNGVLYLVVDSTLKGKRTKKNPLVKKGRLNEYAPSTFGLHLVLLIAQWEVYRVPLAFRLVKPKKSKGYRSENALFRERLEELVLPPWCKMVIVVADAAYASRANLRAIQARGWFFVIAFPRTWKWANGQYLRAIATHLPLLHYRQVRVPLLGPHARYRTFWTFVKHAHLRHIGDVTVVFSRRRRNDSPKQTKLLVTNLPLATARMTVAIYLRRWPVELCFKELKGAMGLGQPQVTREAARVERSVAVALLAYLVVLRLQAKHVKPEASWSVFALKQKFAWEVGAQQIKRTAQHEAMKEIKKLKLAA
jgi:Transposase DDE domain